MADSKPPGGSLCLKLVISNSIVVIVMNKLMMISSNSIVAVVPGNSNETFPVKLFPINMNTDSWS